MNFSNFVEVQKKILHILRPIYVGSVDIFFIYAQ